MLPVLDLLRLFLGASLLSFAAYTDWKWRRAPRVLWRIMLGGGALLLAAQAWQDPAPWSAKWPYLVPLTVVPIILSRSNLVDIVALGLTAVATGLVFWAGFQAPETVTAAWAPLALAGALALFVFAAHYFGLIAGGADAEALLALCLLLPTPVALGEGIPALASDMPGAFSAFGNSMVVFLIVPLGLLLWNLAHGDVRFPHLLLGHRKRAADIQQGHQWPMEIVEEDGTRRTRLFASRMSSEEVATTFERMQALGDERVWVTPKIPFIIPMLAGFVLTFLVGDLLAGALLLAAP